MALAMRFYSQGAVPALRGRLGGVIANRVLAADISRHLADAIHFVQRLGKNATPPVSLESICSARLARRASRPPPSSLNSNPIEYTTGPCNAWIR